MLQSGSADRAGGEASRWHLHYQVASAADGGGDGVTVVNCQAGRQHAAGRHKQGRPQEVLSRASATRRPRATRRRTTVDHCRNATRVPCHQGGIGFARQAARVNDHARTATNQGALRCHRLDLQVLGTRNGETAGMKLPPAISTRSLLRSPWGNCTAALTASASTCTSWPAWKVDRSMVVGAEIPTAPLSVVTPYRHGQRGEQG